MSVIKVNKIESTGTTAGGVEVDSSGHVQVDGVQMPTAGALNNRNLVINGAMQVAQRGTVTGITTTKYSACDRFKLINSSLGTWTASQVTSSPSGFSKALRIDCTTAAPSPAAAGYVAIMYHVEGQDVQHLNYGSSNAQALTLSFYVRSNKTGSASFEIQQRDNSDRQFIKTYTISAANTWEKKTITIPADSSGLINDDTGVGLRFGWWLNSGSNYTTGSVASTWEAEVDANRNTNNLGIGGSTSDYFELSGVQLEVGEKATPFEHRSRGDELARCKRYFVRKNATGYQRGFNGLGMGTVYTTSTAFAYLNHDVEMRAAPTIDHKTIGDFQTISASGSGAITDITISTSTEESTILNIASSSAFNTDRMFILWSNTNGAYIDLDAEL